MLMIGKTLGNFEAITLPGCRGMGEAFLVEDFSLDLKVLLMLLLGLLTGKMGSTVGA
jgi:hypothetical protein